MLAFDDMIAALNELKTDSGCSNNFLANESDSFGIGINSFAKALKPLRRINSIANYRIVYSVRRTDVPTTTGPIWMPTRIRTGFSPAAIRRLLSVASAR